MELKRKYDETETGIKEKPSIKQNLYPLGLYYHLGRYGEDEIRPLYGLFLIFAISFSLWFMLSPYVAKNLEFHIRYMISNFPFDISIKIEQDNVIKGIKFAFERTMSDFFQVNSNSEYIDYLIRIASIIELGILFIALRRKLERQFRH